MTAPSPVRPGPAPPLAVAGVLCALSLAWAWPGVVTYDGVAQYAQIVAGRYDDWHPPIMARLWALSDRAVPGQAPLLVAQMIGWWSGLALTAAALRVRGQARWGWAVIAFGLSPPTLGWLGVAIKDAEMLAAIVAAIGLVGWWRLRAERVPIPARIVAALLLGYATLVRANAPFATVPLALALGGWLGVRGVMPRAALTVAGIGLAILASGPIDHRLLGAEPAHAERTLPLYDLAGIAHRAGAATLPGLPPALWRAAERRGCYGPLMWDAYGDDTRCGFVGERLAFGDRASGAIFVGWLRAIAAHPLAYTAHRLAHLNSALRFVVGWNAVPNAAAPAFTQPNDYGLASPRHLVGQQRIAGAVAASPLGWPILWLVLAIADAVVAFGADPTPAVGVARALALSSLVTSASFAAISIAPDLRYHLWAMTAAGLAALLLAADGAVDRRAAAWAGAALLAVTAIGLGARTIL